MLLMDRENLFARGWSHVLSSSNDLEELETFRQRIGAPPQALHRKNPERPHLDLRGKIRDLALACPDVTVFERSSDLVKYHKAVRGERLAGAASAILPAVDPAPSPQASAQLPLTPDR